MDVSEYREKFTDDDAPCWAAIDRELDSVYKGVEPRHYGTLIKYSLGGPDPIDGVSLYHHDDGLIRHEHMISYGFSDLYYNEESVGGEYSGFGFELTFRVKVEQEGEELHWAINLMQNLARYVFESGNVFDEYHYIPANGPIRADYDTQLTALIFVPDPELSTIQSLHGQVQLLQMVGVTQQEYESILDGETTARELAVALRNDNPLLVTDLDRGGQQ